MAVLSRNTKKVDTFDDLKSKNNKSNYRDCEGRMVGGGLAQSQLAQIGRKWLRYLITPTCLVQSNRNCLLRPEVARIFLQILGPIYGPFERSVIVVLLAFGLREGCVQHFDNKRRVSAATSLSPHGCKQVTTELSY
jgi:hypothetical protein